MEENQKMTKKYICWISDKDKVLSFHHEEGYTRKEFESNEEFKCFILAVSRMYKIQ